MPFAKSLVKQLNGVPVLHIDDVPFHGMTATSVAFQDPEVVRDFTESGVEIMMIWIEIGIKCWKAPGVYDWTYAEEKLRHFAKNSGDTKWIIRIRLGLLARWWAHEHPSEVHNPPGENAGKPDEGLAVANVASSVWAGDVCGIVRDFVTWLKDTEWAPRIAGFMLNAGSTEEWLIFDVDRTTRGQYHPVYTREFRKWLRCKYNGKVDELRASWKTPEDDSFDSELTFETASCPGGHHRKGSHIWGPYSLRDPAGDQRATDYYRFLNETLAKHLIAICRAAKEAAGTPIVCGGFHSYLWWETGVYSYTQEYGHTLIQILNESPWVDFVSDITSYDCRYAGGPSGYLGLPHSLNLNNKLHYTEVDLRTIAGLPEKWRIAWKSADTSAIPARQSEPVIPEKVWNWNNGYCGRDEDEQLALLRREHLHNLITGTPYWWFDIGGHHYQPPFIKKGLKQLSDIGKQSVQWDRRPIAEVAFVCSEDTPMRQASMNGELLRFELESAHGLLIDLCARKWGLAGLPYDTYELYDLNHSNFPGDQYKLIIFVNCADVSEKAAEGVRRWQNNGRTMLWTYAADVFHGGKIAPELAEEVTGIRLGWRNQRQNIHVSVNATHPLCQGGDKLNFGTEGSVGPVFFADDRKATVLGTLRDGGEAAFALRGHGAWRSLYLSMLNFGPDLFRNIARFAGAHIWCGSNDVVYANRSILCLHTATGGPKTVKLPCPAYVTDLWTGERSSNPVESLHADGPHFRTYGWRTEYV